MSGDVLIANVRVDQVHFHRHNVRRDLGDLRTLTDSILRFGVMQPVVLERHGDQLRLRAGHRRLAAARLAGLVKVPAVIHRDALDDDEWLVHAVQENVMRRGLDTSERRDTIRALRAQGVSWEGVADAFGCTVPTAHRWARDPNDSTPRDERKEGLQEHVDRLTAEGRSAAQIADQLRISQRQVVRIRTGTTAPSTSVRARQLQSFADAWRAHAAGHPVTVDEVLDALDRVATTGAIADALPTTRPHLVRSTA